MTKEQTIDNLIAFSKGLEVDKKSMLSHIEAKRYGKLVNELEALRDHISWLLENMEENEILKDE